VFVWRDDVIKQAIRAKIREAIEASAREVQREAVRLAPKRRVLKGMRRARTRKLSGGELRAERSVRKRLGLATSGPIFTTVESNRASRPSNAYLRGAGRRPQSPANDDDSLRTRGRALRGRLNAYGRRAVLGPRIENPEYRGTYKDQARIKAIKASNSAWFRNAGSGKWQLGGRLKGEIRYSIEEEKHKIKATIISPTYYAKYVEFGTRRSRAQPFLRPALAKERRNLRRRIEGRLRNLGAPR
jgi:HK97 gp10 family phage protein